MIQILLLVALIALNPLHAFAGQDRVSELKSEIISLAKANTTNETEFPLIRQKLNQLIAELQSLTPKVDEQLIATYSPGSWKQVWSDERNMDVVGGPKRDLNQIYQYVNPAGWAFNFGVRTLPNNQQVTFALKVQASVENNRQRTEITAAFLRMTPLRTEESIAEISQQIYSGTSTNFQQRDAGQFPKGPIGAVGFLELQYLDADIKIGIADNVFTGESEMFVMERL